MLQLINKTSDKGPLWLVQQKYVLGSDSRCDITIIDESVKPQHAELLVSGDNVELINLAGGIGLEVNGELVSESKKLAPCDVFCLGSDTFELLDPKAIRAANNSPVPSNVWSLKALNTALADKSFPLNGIQVIGRSQESDICLGVVHLSRKHAKISVRENGLHILDLNSANGTFINNKKVSQALAAAGDELCFDTLRFRVIGPMSDDNATELRVASDDIDLTTVRPALQMPNNVSPPKPASKNKPRPRPSGSGTQQPKPQSQDSVTQETVSVSKEKTGRSVGLWLVAVLAVGAGIGWYFLQ